MDIRHPFPHDSNHPAVVPGFRLPVSPGGVIRRLRRFLPAHLRKPQNRKDLAPEVEVKGQGDEDGPRESDGDDDPGQNGTCGQKGERNGGQNAGQRNASGYKNERHLGQIPLNHERSLFSWNYVDNPDPPALRGIKKEKPLHRKGYGPWSG